ncbi:MAG: hypothetical protein Q8P48_01305 [Deltaproteobacteria bacterium]|nr:hypothetical protein [Deltaproteobacteria bacterium]
MDFSKEQQAAIDGMISKRVGEIKTKHEKELAEAVEQAEAKAGREIETLKAEKQTLEASRGQDSERIRRALLKAEVAQVGAVNTVQVLKLVNENFKLGEDGELVVVDDEGTPQLDESGRPHTAGGFIEKFLTDNPHLARAASRAGGGSFMNHGTGATNTMRRASFDALDASRKTNFVRSGGQVTD